MKSQRNRVSDTVARYQLTHILRLTQKPGLLRIVNRTNPDLSFINPVSLCLLIMVQDMNKVNMAIDVDIGLLFDFC